MSQLALVQRPFDATGTGRQRGELVDTEGWRFGRVRVLIQARYLKEAPAGVTPVTCDCGRMWVSEEAMRAHEAPAPESRPEPESVSTSPPPEASERKARPTPRPKGGK